jgi:RNA polymerase sigma factor (sigma-70 family)
LALLFFKGEIMDANKSIQNSSDSELLHAIQKGNREAAQELCRRHDPELRGMTVGFLRGKGCNQPGDHGEEVKSRAWVKIIRYIDDLDDVRKFNGWRDTIARNEAKEHLKTCITAQNTSIELEDEALTVGTQIFDYYKSRDAAIDAAKMLRVAENISPEFGLIFRLHTRDDLAFDEIALLLGKNKGTVRTVYFRGLLKLKAEFRSRGG